MTEIVDVAIIGAGPYGLSLAAHLAATGIEFRIFGSPMHTWRSSMPEGMVLKSEGNASDLWDPAKELTLARYSADNGLQYRDTGYPIPLSIFIDYGIAFQRRFVPGLEEQLVRQVLPTGHGFDLLLEDGEIARARRLIVAAGIRAYEYLPPQLASLPTELASHSAQHVRVDSFRGREVAIIGGGASAINLAALLHQNDATVTLVVRKDRIDYCGPPAERSLWEKVREPENGLGTGWRSWACCAMPGVFHAMPEAFRLMVVRKHLPAAPGWTLKPQVDGIVSTLLGASIGRADEVGGRVRLALDRAGGERTILTADHVIAATGYRVDVRRLSFFGSTVLDRLNCVQHTPRLTRHFESSIPGLYFVGTAAANSFGPMLRFAYGAGFTSRRLAGHLKHVRSPHTMHGDAAAGWSKANLVGT
jgi:thioredoxin reductase